MALQKLDRVVWEEFCLAVSNGWAREHHEIEIRSDAEIDAIDGQWLPAIRMTWKHDTSCLELVLRGFGQLTLHPYELYVDCSERGLEGMCILDSQEGWRTMLLRQPLDLMLVQLTAGRN